MALSTEDLEWVGPQTEHCTYPLGDWSESMREFLVNTNIEGRLMVSQPNT